MAKHREPPLDVLLRDLGRHARAAAPPFEPMWRVAQARLAAPPQRRTMALAAAAALAACVAVGLALSTARHPAVGVDVMAWRSPTATLLATPGREWLAGPRLGQSALNGLDVRFTDQETE